MKLEEKISLSLKKKWHDEQFKQSMIEKMQGVKKDSSSKEKYSIAVKKRWQDPEARKKMVEGMRGKKRSPETKAKLREIQMKRRMMKFEGR